MKLADYLSYTGSIDFLSSPQVNPEIDFFIELLSKSLPQVARVVDVGGGTGYILARILKQRSDLTATLIEPATIMHQQAEVRLSGKAVLINATIKSALPDLQPLDAFIFCRSLYALDDFLSLFAALADKLTSFGQLFILEPNPRLYDIPSYHLGLERRLSPDQLKELQHHWPVIKAALQRFNEGVQNNEFTLFQPEGLHQIADKSGFDKIFYRAPGMYGFRKHH
ncbi:MAG: methyltransferase domain-containing protein [Methylococcales bacterium]|nr:methyltransferase domain-containing protein [Methylococcales bacterium]